MTDLSRSEEASIARRLARAPVAACAVLVARQGARRPDTRSIARLKRWLAGAVLVLGAIGLSMALFDEPAIKAQLPRGAPELWWVRIYTELGQSEYMLPILAALVVVSLIAGAIASRPMTRGVLAALTTRMAFLLFAVGAPVVIGEVVKDVVGRARPFVGGSANAFLFSPFANEARFESFPSGHAIAAFALAFAVASLWPRTWIVMLLYAVLIAVSRVVLLAHHPSDVIGGAAIGVFGAMLVRYWFARRRLGFVITEQGRICAMPGPSWRRLKRVAGTAFSK